ncbi:hypothetical protein ABBQ38_013099 [Trebouxia sp. C0009 RCD-2024]
MLHKLGDVCLPGLAARYWFVHRLYKKLKVRFQVFRRGKYKMNDLTKMSKAQRANLQDFANSQMDQIVEDVAAARGLTPKQVMSAVSSSPMSMSEAVDRGLITGTKYRADATRYLSLDCTHPAARASAARASAAQDSAMSHAAALNGVTRPSTSQTAPAQDSRTSAAASASDSSAVPTASALDSARAERIGTTVDGLKTCLTLIVPQTPHLMA